MSPGMRAAVLALGLVLLRCQPEKVSGGTGAGNPPLAEVALVFRANSLTDSVLRKSAAAVIRNPDGTFEVFDSAGSAIKISSLTIAVRKIDLSLPVGLTCESAPGYTCDSDGISLPGPFVVDLMTGASNPPLEHLRLPEGVYTRVGLELSDNESAPAVDTNTPNMEIRGGTDSADGRARPFSVRLNLRDGLDFDGPTGIRITAAALNKLLLQLTVDDWFKTVDLKNCLEASGSTAGDSGVTLLAGDGFCQGAGLRIRQKIEASGDINEEK